MTTKRRKPGEGSARSYETTAGTRWLIVYGVKDQVTGARRQKLIRGFLNEKSALAELRKRSVAAAAPSYVEPSKRLTGEYLDEWLAGLRNEPSTVASYSKNVRLHLKPRLEKVPLLALTGTGLTALYRELETSGRKDGKEGGLSARTVRYIHTILHRALKDAVDDGLLPVNPADKAKPPTAKQAAAPEMKVWDAEQLRTFLERDDELRPAWVLLAMTGMRRGEALALRWGDVDWTADTVSIRRSVGLVRTHGVGHVLHVGPPKNGKPRVVDLDPATLATLKAYRSQRAGIALGLVRDDALVLGRPDGELRHPEHFSREWIRRMGLCPELPYIRLHDLRHTHATLLLKAGVPVKVVSERLGHASAQITLQTYQHVLPGMQREAADKLASLVYGGSA